MSKLSDTNKTPDIENIVDKTGSKFNGECSKDKSRPFKVTLQKMNLAKQAVQGRKGKRISCHDDENINNDLPQLMQRQYR